MLVSLRRLNHSYGIFCITPLFLFQRYDCFSSSSSSSSSCAIPNLSSKFIRVTPKTPFITQKELTQINLLIPRLCLLHQLTTAIHLTTASLPLLLNDPLFSPTKDLSLSILIHSLTSQPHISLPISLLTILKHTPLAHPLVPYIATSLITSYLKKMRPLEAFKVYKGVVRRPGSCFHLGKDGYGVLVCGFCENGLVVEALSVLRDMLSVGIMPGTKLRKKVYMSLLREAMVEEALEIDVALCGCVVEDIGGEGVKKALNLLDTIGAN